jgi:hypothetical protein
MAAILRRLVETAALLAEGAFADAGETCRPAGDSHRVKSSSPFLTTSTAYPVDSGLAQAPETLANPLKNATLLSVLLPVLLYDKAANVPA